MHFPNSHQTLPIDYGLTTVPISLTINHISLHLQHLVISLMFQKIQICHAILLNKHKKTLIEHHLIFQSPPIIDSLYWISHIILFWNCYVFYLQWHKYILLVLLTKMYLVKCIPKYVLLSLQACQVISIQFLLRCQYICILLRPILMHLHLHWWINFHQVNSKRNCDLVFIRSFLFRISFRKHNHRHIIYYLEHMVCK